MGPITLGTKQGDRRWHPKRHGTTSSVVSFFIGTDTHVEMLLAIRQLVQEFSGRSVNISSKQCAMSSQGLRKAVIGLVIRGTILVSSRHKCTHTYTHTSTECIIPTPWLSDTKPMMRVKSGKVDMARVRFDMLSHCCQHCLRQ